MRINGNIKIGNFNTTLNDIATNNNKLNSIITYETLTGLNLGAGDTYQLNFPANTIFVEPLVSSAGSENSGGQFITPGANFSYITNNDNNSSYRGIWVRCDSSGLFSISTYRHCGCPITGFRIWYIDI